MGCMGRSVSVTRGAGGASKARVHYESHISTLFLQEGENSCTIIVGMVLFMV